MFNIKTLTAIAVSTLLFTACEKDQGITPDNSMTTSGKTSGGNGDKSTDEIPGLQDFIDQVVKNNDIPGDFSMEDAVLFTEAALNVQLSNMGEHLITTDSLYTFETVFNTNASNETGLVEGADISDFYNSIKDQVIAIGNSNFSNGDVHVSSVDISYGEHFNKSAVMVYIKFGRLFASGDCDLTGDYKAVFGLGGCGTNFGTRPNTDAAREVSHRLQRGNCNTPLVRCGKRSIYYNLITYPDFYASPADYWNRERYYMSAVGNISCVSELTQDAWYSRMDAFIANEFPYVGTGGRLITPYDSWLQTLIRPLSSFSSDVYVNNLTQFGDCTFINDIGVIKMTF